MFDLAPGSPNYKSVLTMSEIKEVVVSDNAYNNSRCDSPSMFTYVKKSEL